MEALAAPIKRVNKPGGGRPRKDGLPNKLERAQIAAALELDPEDLEPRATMAGLIGSAAPSASVVGPNAGYDATTLGQTVVERRTLGLKMDYAKLNSEEIKYKINELDYHVRSRQYISRAIIKDLFAKHHAIMVQKFRMIPDICEHKLQMSGEVTELIGREIDAALAQFAEEMSVQLEDV